MKKDFKTSGGLSTILGENKAPEKAKVGRPKTSPERLLKALRREQRRMRLEPLL
jgi:hypothetical protein